jgi:pyruvate, water dikinase
MAGYTARFADIGTSDAATVGGKGASLGELTRAGARVPPGFVVTTAAFVEAMAAADADGGHRARIAGLDPDDLDAVAGATAGLRRRIAESPLPDAVRGAVLAGYRDLEPGGAAPVAVRSSATAEDSADASFAGLQDTYLWVRGEDEVLAHVRRCWASLYSVESVTYRLRRRLAMPEERLAMAVVVQRMVDPRCAGVMFTRSPLTGDRSVIALEAAWGLGSALVSGDVTPDRFVVSKVTGEIVKRVVSTKLRRHRLDPESGAGVREEDVPDGLRDACCLTDDEVTALVAVAKRIEEHFGVAQDVEWAIAGDAVFVLQSRPETVWARRDAAPVAAPRPRAFDHILDVLGGRR